MVCIGNNRRDYITLKNISAIKIIKSNIKLKLAGSKPGKVYFSDRPEVEFLPFLTDAEFRDLTIRLVLILPLLEGGSSQTVNEALSCGLPIVTK